MGEVDEVIEVIEAVRGASRGPTGAAWWQHQQPAGILLTRVLRHAVYGVRSMAIVAINRLLTLGQVLP